MDNSDAQKLQGTLSTIRNLTLESKPKGHDLINALHTLLCSIEMLDLDITAPQREEFGRLEQSAKHLEDQVQAYLRSSRDLMLAVVNQIDTPSSG